MKLRVAIDATPLLGPRTGIGVATEALLKRLPSDPTLDVTGFVVSMRGRNSLAAALPPGVRPLGLRYSARMSRTLWKYLDWPRLSEFDVVHGTNFVVPPSRNERSNLVTINDLTPWIFPELATSDTRRYPKLVERARRRGAHVHAISHYVGDEVVEKLGFDRERVHSIPLGHDPGPAGNSQHGHSAAGTDSYIVAIGTIEPRKDYPSLLRALAELRATEHRDLKLVVIGSDGWASDEFNRELRNLRLGDAVIRTGFVSQQVKADLLAGALCLAYPSVYEGFGMPPLEAMAAGVPVVTTKAGAVPEVVGDAALVVEVSNSGAMAAAIARVISDSSLRSELISKGAERVGLFKWSHTVHAMSSLYRMLAS